MGLDTNTRPVVKAVEAYFDHNTTPEQMHLISKMLNTSAEAPDKLQQKFIYYLSYSNATRVKRLLDLLEYLTIFSTAKVPELVNNDKFVENFSSAIMEPDFQRAMLNLLRLWHDKYMNVQKDLNRIFELIENLVAFDIPLPSTFVSKYEGVDPESLYQNLPNKDKETEEKSRPPAINLQKSATPPNTDLGELFTKSKNVEQKALHLINDPDFKYRPIQYREETAQLIIEDLADQLIEFNSLLSCDYSSEIKERIKDVITHLNKIHGQIRQKLNEAEESGAMEIEDNTYGPHLPGHKSNTPKHSGNENLSYPTILAFDEFLSYKIEPCHEGNKCKFVSTQGKGTSGQNSELICPYWHGLQDRRRPVCDERGNTLYNFTLCHHKEDCSNLDKCQMSHNFVETFFHPLNYKKKRCAAAGVCRTGKYCPYFHSQEEKGTWSNCLREWFNVRDNDDEYSNMTEFDWGDNDENAHFKSISSHIPPSVLIPNQIIPLPPAESNDSKKNNEQKAESPQVASQLPLVNELHGKLKVRQNYIKPQEITGIFYNNPCFHNFPFVLPETFQAPPNTSQEKI